MFTTASALKLEPPSELMKSVNSRPHSSRMRSQISWQLSSVVSPKRKS